MDIKPSLFNLQKLALQWQVFGQLMVLFARRLVALKKMGERNASADAEQLALWAGAGLVQINRQILVLAENTLESECAEHFDHLKAIAVCLLALLMFAQKLRADFIKLGKAARHDAIGFVVPAYLLSGRGRRCVPAFVRLDPG